LRRRYGRSAADLEEAEDTTAPEKDAPGAEAEKPKVHGDVEREEVGGSTRERMFSWVDIIRAGAQLTLDLMRVLREGTDLYRKLHRGKGGMGT